MTQFTVPEKIFQLIPETTSIQNHPAKNTEKSRSTPPLGRNTAGLHPSGALSRRFRKFRNYQIRIQKINLWF